MKKLCLNDMFNDLENGLVFGIAEDPSEDQIFGFVEDLKKIVSLARGIANKSMVDYFAESCMAYCPYKEIEDLQEILSKYKKTGKIK